MWPISPVLGALRAAHGRLVTPHRGRAGLWKRGNLAQTATFPRPHSHRLSRPATLGGLACSPPWRVFTPTRNPEAPYFDADGTAVKATQFRLQLEKGAGSNDDRFRWKKGDHPTHYGLQRLADARRAGRLTIVEGPSCAQTCWLHDVPSLALSNADAKQFLQCHDLVSEIERIDLVVEPDEGGRTLVRALAQAGFRDRVWLVSLGADKDVSGLYLRDPEHFMKNWQAALDKATHYTSTTVVDHHVRDDDGDDPEDEDDDEGGGQTTSAATRLVELALEANIDLFHDPDGAAYARVITRSCGSGA